MLRLMIGIAPPEPRRSGLLAPALMALAALLVLVQLGNWQMQRLAWKTELIERIETRTSRSPVALPRPEIWDQLASEDYEYLPIRATGRFLHDKELHVYTSLLEPKGRFGGPGYWVLTPLALADGGHVLVNRGFVPLTAKDPAARPQGQIEGEVTITGLLRAPELRNPFTPDDQPDRNIWFTRDPRGMNSVALGVPRLAPFFVDVSAGEVPGGLPQPGETRLRISNRHLDYALTWYGLALTLFVMFIAFAWSRLRSPARS